ncbi:hypothetical protein D3C85_755520 [compost metagenome]
MARDAFVFVLAADHEAGDVLQEHQRNLALRAQLDKVRAFLRGFGKQDAVVGNDAHGHALNVRKARDQRGAEAGLEFIELRAVHDARDDFAHVVGLAGVGGNDAVQFVGVVARFARGDGGQLRGLLAVQPRDGVARQLQRVHVVGGQVVHHAGQARVHVAAAQVFGADFFARGGLHQRRAAQEDGALVLHDDGFIAHGRHIRAARGARTHHHGDLRNALRGHLRLVVEDAAEVFAVGEHFVLLRQVGAARIHQVDAGQMVLRGDLLRAQMLLDRHRVVRAALDGGVVADDDAFGARHAADAGDDARAGRIAVVHIVCRHGRQFQERGARIDQVFNAVARQQLAARHMLGARGFTAAQRCLRQLLIQIIQLRLHGTRIVGEILRPRIDAGFDDGHGVPPVLRNEDLKA